MRIQPHTTLTLEAERTGPIARQASSQAAGATQPASDRFASLFQTLSTAGPGSVTQRVAPPAGKIIPTTATTTTATTTPSTASTASTTPAAASSATVQNPGIQALVSAIMNGTFQATYVTSAAQLQESTPAGTTDIMPNFYYASNQTADRLASLLGGTVVQRPAFGQDQGWNEPLANFIQLPNGQTLNAADVSYYANTSSEGASQLTADITQTINEGAAWTNYYVNGGQIPSFPTGYVGPPIAGMSYPAGSIGADGNVINPAMSGVGA